MVLKAEDISAYSVAAISHQLKDFRIYFQSPKYLKPFFASSFFLPASFLCFIYDFKISDLSTAK